MCIRDRAETNSKMKTVNSSTNSSKDSDNIFETRIHGSVSITSFKSVSYTHLDVYKRQVQGFFQTEWYNGPSGSWYPGHESACLCGKYPVSYTHLNFYWRTL